VCSSDLRGVELRVVPGDAFTPQDVERFMDDRTRLVTLSSVAFHNGFAPDLEGIGAVCARRGVLFCVDAIQSVGMLPIDVRRCNISLLAADGHKWMCGPEGAALFYVAEEHRDAVEPVEMGWTNIQRRGTFIGCGTEYLPDARRYEAGSLNTNGIYGLRAAIELLLEIGMETIAAEALRVAELLAEGLESIGFRVATARPVPSAIVGATPPVVDGRELLRLHGALEKEGIVCAPREGMLRFSPHFYNDEKEVTRVVDVLRALTR